MKPLCTVCLALLTLLAPLAAQGSKEPSGGPSGNLVVYSPDFDEELDIFIDSFTETYPGITVETVNAGAGELRARLKAEAANPTADVMLGGLVYADATTDADLFDPYIPAADATLPKAMRNNTDGLLTYRDVQLVCLLVNKTEAARAGVTITGYADLLDPRLKGRIISADPAASSSAWNQLSTMLAVMGGYESDAAWEYVEALVRNLDGVAAGSSSAVYTAVAHGEYVVGITYEAPCVSLIEHGMGDELEIVYPTEGVNAILGCVAMVKGCRNRTNAALFIDSCVSDKVQARLAASTIRQANTDLPTTNRALTPYADIKLVDRDEAYLAAHRKEILERYRRIWASYN